MTTLTRTETAQVLANAFTEALEVENISSTDQLKSKVKNILSELEELIAGDPLPIQNRTREEFLAEVMTNLAGID